MCCLTSKQNVCRGQNRTLLLSVCETPAAACMPTPVKAETQSQKCLPISFWERQNRWDKCSLFYRVFCMRSKRTDLPLPLWVLSVVIIIIIIAVFISLHILPASLFCPLCFFFLFRPALHLLTRQLPNPFHFLHISSVSLLFILPLIYLLLSVAWRP